MILTLKNFGPDLGHPLLDSKLLFSVGESGSGRASRGVAQHVPGSGQSSFEGLRVAHNFQRLQMQVRERGEKVAELQDKSEEMGESAKKFASAANTVSFCVHGKIASII